MYPFVRLIAPLLAISVVGCWSQHRGARTSSSGESYLAPFFSRFPSVSVKSENSNLEHSPKSETPGREMHPQLLLVEPLNVYNFERIKVGMHRDEVEKLLGGAPGHYGRNQGDAVGTAEAFGAAEGMNLEIWTNDSTSLEIVFDKDDLVNSKHKRAGYGRLPYSDKY